VTNWPKTIYGLVPTNPDDAVGYPEPQEVVPFSLAEQLYKTADRYAKKPQSEARLQRLQRALSAYESQVRKKDE
jgi:hypothetical protein